MDSFEVEAKIEEVLASRKAKVVNKNAVRALMGVFGPQVGALSAIFLGRQDAIDSEKQRIQIDLILELLTKIDDSISSFNRSSLDKGVVVDGLIETHVKSAHEAIGLEIGNGTQATLQPGTHIRTVATDVHRAIGIKII